MHESTLADRRFFFVAACMLAVLALAGFAPSFYLRRLVAEPVPLTGLMAVHGLAWTAWVLLLVVQATLALRGNLRWHRRLGWAGVAVVVAMLGLSGTLALERTRVWVEDPQFDSSDVLQFLLTPTTTIVYFAAMFGAALYYRRRTDIHQRLLLIASLDVFTPAMARLPWMNTQSTTWHYAAMDLVLVALALHDWRTRRAVHVATLVGGVLLIASQAGRELLAGTDTWMSVAVWLVYPPVE